VIPPDTQGYALKRGEGRSIDFRGTKMTVKVPGAQVGESYSLIEMVHPPTVGPALHVHPTGAEAFYVLEGAYTIHSGEETYLAAPGDFVYIPKGVKHQYQSGAKGGTVLVLSPAGLERYFTEVADLLRVGTITWEVEQAIAKQYGQEFLDKLKHWGQ
jgi:quercetin dioxygenase-like cupin family protein